jgi:hypoxanthine phosphoribosyltransferase
MSRELEVLTWERFGSASRELASLVVDDGYRPDIILAIARGGLLVAGALAYALSVKNCYVINVEYYTGIDERLDFPVILPPPLNLVDVHDARVLVADDVADTGHTLRAVHDFVLGKVGEVRSAVLYKKPRSVISCEYAWARTDRWIDFPWSSEPPILGE